MKLWLCVASFLLFFSGSSVAREVSAAAYIVTDMSGTVLLEKNADVPRSIASITKLITTRASTAQDPNELITILQEDMMAGRMRSSALKVNQNYTRAQLQSLALVASDNVAAIALARSLKDPMVAPEGITWVEGSGLNPGNSASARDLAKLAREMVNTELAHTSVQPTISIGALLRRSTNPMLEAKGWNFSLSKTGFINEAGGCVVTIFQAGGRQLVAVILGSRNVPERWRDLYELRRQINPDEEFAAPLGRPVTNAVTKKKHRYK